jgi:uncharacterized DUF497 family protein
MYAYIQFNEAAFRHGITKANIHYAFWHPVVDIAMEDAENKNLLIGIDSSGNFLEIFYNEIDEQSINVFHAMKCRKKYLELIGL